MSRSVATQKTLNDLVAPPRKRFFDVTQGVVVEHLPCLPSEDLDVPVVIPTRCRVERVHDGRGRHEWTALIDVDGVAITFRHLDKEANRLTPNRGDLLD